MKAILKEFYSLEENNIGKLSMRTGVCKCICVNDKMHVFQISLSIDLIYSLIK